MRHADDDSSAGGASDPALRKMLLESSLVRRLVANLIALKRQEISYGRRLVIFIAIAEL